ncbi:DUF2282 domain-containing protein [Pseudoxanthobacter sp.]|uniref:BufA1 family periplasmic bufferin-type metallophore n=1 Tax=Pseudoxanthobacter sp. TaxID=1925742 RepID=UPI002FE044E1
MKTSILSVAVAASVLTAIGSLSAGGAAAGDQQEKCYGVALKGQNDCAAGKHDCAGKATMDYDKASFKLVPAGTCTQMKTPHGHGTLKPM